MQDPLLPTGGHRGGVATRSGRSLRGREDGWRHPPSVRPPSPGLCAPRGPRACPPPSRSREGDGPRGLRLAARLLVPLHDCGGRGNRSHKDLPAPGGAARPHAHVSGFCRSNLAHCHWLARKAKQKQLTPHTHEPTTGLYASRWRTLLRSSFCLPSNSCTQIVFLIFCIRRGEAHVFLS